MHGKVLKGPIWIPYFLPFSAFVLCDFWGIRPPSCWLWWCVPERSPDHGDQINSPPWKGRKGCQCAPRRVSLPHWCYDYSFNQTMSAKWLHWMPSCMKGEHCLLKDSDLIGTLILFILFFSICVLWNTNGWKTNTVISWVINLNYSSCKCGTFYPAEMWRISALT